MRKAARRIASAAMLPLVRRAAKAYIAGDRLSDALAVEERLAGKGFAATVGFWDGPGVSPRQVADEYLAGLRAVAERKRDGYLSIKLPALGFDQELLGEVAAEAARLRTRLHFDAMWPETVDQTKQAIDLLLAGARQTEAAAAVSAAGLAVSAAACPGALPVDPPAAPPVSFTLPGRWVRSIADAQWVIDRQLAVRVVRGQWPDPAAPDRDSGAGYLQVVNALAGRAAHVAIATHNAPLAVKALSRLIDAGTSCELEMLYGLPLDPCGRIARELRVPVRVYVPYGSSFLPYALGQARRNPRIFWWMLRDTVRSWLGRA